MEHATLSPDQIASRVFWIIMLAAAGFVVAAIILIR